VNNWKIPNLEYELGPFIGNAPHFISNPDSKFDIDDGMAFMKMWSWYQKTYGEIVNEVQQVGLPLQIFFNEDTLFIVIEENISAGQFQFKYANLEDPPLTFKNKKSNVGSLFLDSHLSKKGFSIIEFARENIDLKIDTIKISYDKKNKINLFYALVSSEKTTIQKGSLEFDPKLLPDKLSLNPAFPNPFNPLTTLRFDIPETINSNFVFLNIYDIKGRMVKKLAEGSMVPGRHLVKWVATNFSSGVYFVKLTYDNQSRTQKLILLK
jgi:hypothetical protein